MPYETFRIIDANCNRLGEGFRFLEDVARFVLNDADLSQQLKTMRHTLVKNLSKFGPDLLTTRDAEKDVGIHIESFSEQQDLPSLITANAKRAEEALRVIEEIAKIPEISHILDTREFKQARFDLYTLERRLLSSILRKHKAAQVAGLYVILDTQVLGMKNEIDVAAKAIRGGVKVIQLRDKHRGKGDLLVIAQKLKEICFESNVLFIINDYLEIALAVDADGVHIGQEDLPISVVRKELPVDRIVGCSTHNLTQALKAEADGADYIAVGSIFPSPTKRDATVIGLEELSNIKQAISTPLVAIGGINKDNIAQVISAGADSLAVISAVLNKDNVEEAARQLVKEIEKKTKGHK